MLKRFHLASIPVKPLELTKYQQHFCCWPLLALPLGNIKNLSIKLSAFPEECKIAKLKPILKKGARTDPKNNRPIAFLPVVSKIIEKSIHFLIEDYLNKKKTNLYVAARIQDETFNRPLSSSVDRLCCNWYG